MLDSSCRLFAIKWADLKASRVVAGSVNSFNLTVDQRTLHANFTLPRFVGLGGRSTPTSPLYTMYSIRNRHTMTLQLLQSDESSRLLKVFEGTDCPLSVGVDSLLRKTHVYSIRLSSE